MGRKDDEEREGSVIEPGERNKVERIYLDLRYSILSGKWRFGKDFKVAELLEEYPVTKPTILLVLHWLTAEGYVRGDAPPFYTLREWTADDLRSLYEARCAIEGQAARLAATNVGRRDLEWIKGAHRDIRNTLNADRVNAEVFIERGRDIHMRLVAASASRALMVAWDSCFVPALHRRAAWSMTHRDMCDAHRDHERLIKALEARDSELAHGLVIATLRTAMHLSIESVGGFDVPERDTSWHTPHHRDQVDIDFPVGNADPFFPDGPQRVITQAKDRWWFHE